MPDLPLVIQAPLNKARKDKFRLILTIPNILKTLNAKNSRESEYLNLDCLQFSVYGVNVPPVEVAAHQLHYAGQNYNITSYDRPAAPPTTVNFTIDNEFKNYWVIWKWLQLLNDIRYGTFNGPEISKNAKLLTDPKILYDYSTLITLQTLDEYDKKKVEFSFLNSFVTRLGNFAYSYRDPEEIDCSFEFVFNQLDIQLI
jgi:hypothetical protein